MSLCLKIKKCFWLIIISLNPYFLVGQTPIKLIEYYPAPGQFINVEGIGTPDAALSLEDQGNNIVSLGTFGGYLTIQFINPVENDPENPFGVDFVVFGNSGKDFSEPASVMVMKDENKNGKADDNWYELAGSDYFFTGTIKDYNISYFEPDPGLENQVFWEDNLGMEGYIISNSFHTQNYYPSASFDHEFYSGSCIFKGSLIQTRVDFSNPYQIRSIPRYFGYADNRPAGDKLSLLPDNPYSTVIEGMGGDPMDISWAVDDKGNYVEIDQVDFVKIYTSTKDHAGPLGELSSEISGIEDIAPQKDIKGEERLLVIEDIPQEILPGEYELYSHYFEQGKHKSFVNTTWAVSEGPAHIKNNNILVATEKGKIKLVAKYEDLERFIETQVVDAITGRENLEQSEIFNIYPVPFMESFTVEGDGIKGIKLFSLTGKEVFSAGNISDSSVFSPGQLTSGIYLLEVEYATRRKYVKIFKAGK